jgi:hypothetical protein
MIYRGRPPCDLQLGHILQLSNTHPRKKWRSFRHSAVEGNWSTLQDASVVKEAKVHKEERAFVALWRCAIHKPYLQVCYLWTMVLYPSEDWVLIGASVTIGILTGAHHPLRAR